MVGIKDIAKRCGVSTATVSNVLNGKPKASEETVMRVLAAVEELGYHPNEIAKGLRTKRTYTVAVIAEEMGLFTTVDNISAITARCEERGYRVVLYNMRLFNRWSDKWFNRPDYWHEALDPIIKKVQASNVDGVIYLAGLNRHILFSSDIPKIPTVLAYAQSDTPFIPSIVPDDEKSAEDVVRYLISMGHRRIGFIGGKEDNLHTQYRLEGYRRELSGSGIEFDPELVFFGTWERESGTEGAAYLEGKGVTAIFACNDKMAGGVYDYLEQKGLTVGKDMSVVGFDNEIISSYFYPKLTTMELPLYEIGLKAADMLVDMIEKGGTDEDDRRDVSVIRVPCSMKVRDSVGKITDNHGS